MSARKDVAYLLLIIFSLSFPSCLCNSSRGLADQVLKDLAETPPDGDDDDHSHGTFHINMFTMAPVRVHVSLLFSLLFCLL